MRFHSALALALALNACASYGPDLSVDSDPEARPYVKQALAAWHLGSYEPSRNVVRLVSPNSEWLTTRADAPIGKVAGVTYYHSTTYDRWVTIYVSNALSPADLQKTVNHEIGHMLRFQLCEKFRVGHLPDGNLMAPTLGAQAPVPTTADEKFILACE